MSFSYGGAIKVFRDWIVDLLPSSGVHDPIKSEIRALLGEYEARLDTLDGIVNALPIGGVESEILQQVETHTATAARFLPEINGVELVAFAWHYTDAAQYEGSAIHFYQRDALTGFYDFSSPYFSIEYPDAQGVTDIKYGFADGRHWLFQGNTADGVTGEVPSLIWEIVAISPGIEFVKHTVLDQGAVSHDFVTTVGCENVDFRVFSDGQEFCTFACAGGSFGETYAQNSLVFKLLGSSGSKQWTYYQSISAYGVRHLKLIETPTGAKQLGVVQFYSDEVVGSAARGHSIECRILNYIDDANGWNTAADAQLIETDGGNYMIEFEANGDSFIAISCRENDRMFAVDCPVLKWNGSSWAAFQKLRGSGGTRIESFTDGGTTYLALANLLTGDNLVSFNDRSTVVIYRVEKYLIRAVRTLRCNGAYSMSFNTTLDSPSRPIIAIAESFKGNSLNGGSRITDSSVRVVDTGFSGSAEHDDLAGVLRGARQMVYCSSFGQVGGGQTRYFNTSGTYDNEGAARMPAPFHFHARKLKVQLSAAPGSGQSVTVTFVQSGGDSELSVTLTGASNTAEANAELRAVIAENETWSIKAVFTSGASNAVVHASFIAEAA